MQSLSDLLPSSIASQLQVARRVGGGGGVLPTGLVHGAGLGEWTGRWGETIGEGRSTVFITSSTTPLSSSTCSNTPSSSGLGQEGDTHIPTHVEPCDKVTHASSTSPYIKTVNLELPPSPKTRVNFSQGEVTPSIN